MDPAASVRGCGELPPYISIGVNISAAQCQDALVQTVVSALAASRLPPERLELEITESALLHDNSTTTNVLHKLRALGVRIAMDDFGTGYSSLSYLRSFPFDKIKIDQSFVRELGVNPDCLVIVRAVAGLGASFGVRPRQRASRPRSSSSRSAMRAALMRRAITTGDRCRPRTCGNPCNTAESWSESPDPSDHQASRQPSSRRLGEAGLANEGEFPASRNASPPPTYF
jgi:hypothetical protein